MRRSHRQPALDKAQTMLDRLPNGAVVIDKYGHAWQLGRCYWYRAYGDESEVSSYELSFRAPLKHLE